ncbi:g8470 [Coccomyxa elongata]
METFCKNAHTLTGSCAKGQYLTRRFASFVHSHAGRSQAKQSKCAGEGTSCRSHHTSIVTATAVVARSAEQKAESTVSIPSVVPASLATAVVEDEDLATRFDSIESALQALSQGHMVVVLDDEKRENEGDLIMAADKVTPADVEFLRKHTSGYICVGMEGDVLDRLQLPLMVSSAENDEAMYTAFTVTVDAREGISTGISAEDRARTLRLLADPAASPADFRRPGHINPLRSRPGGVLTRPGHTEAAVDMCRLAGCQPAGALCEIVNPEDGSMARTPQLLEFAARHGLRCVTIADLVRYRLQHDMDQKPQPDSSSNGALHS